MDVKRLLIALACMGGMALAQQDTLVVNRTFLWDGTIDTIGRVETGSPDSTSGWWYDFTDEDDGGSSYIQFPADIEIYQDGLEFGHLAEYYGGLDLKVLLGKGYDYPYAGIAFNVWNLEMKGADISAWGGFCLSYKSTLGFEIELVPEDEANVTETNNYKATVAKAASMTTQTFSWKKFKQDSGWGKEANLDSVLAKTAAVRLTFRGLPETKGDFLIQKIGDIGQCGCCPLPFDKIESSPIAAPVKATLSGRTLEFTGATALANVSIVDLQGNIVISAPALGAMDLSMFPSGIYMLRIEGPAVHHTQKIVLK